MRNAKSSGLATLRLHGFRNHGALELSLDQRFIIITGPNGAGKTNILEAVSLLVPGRGLRRATLTDMAGQGGNGGFTIHAEMAEGTKLGTGITADQPSRRLVRINGAQAATNDLAERLAIIWLTPQLDRLFLDGASERRRFVDRMALALNPAHGRASSRYEAAMRERNKLLTDSRMPDAKWLDAIEARMAEYGAEMMASRLQLTDWLAPILAASPEGAFARPMIDLIGPDGKACYPETEDSLAQAFWEGRKQDAAAGRTLAGPHRTDLSVYHAAKNQPAALCSTGEQKALLLALVLAHAELVAQKRDAPPLLLLDEIAAHLDEFRRAALFEQLADLGGQIWMTGTDKALFDSADPSLSQHVTLDENSAAS